MAQTSLGDTRIGVMSQLKSEKLPQTNTNKPRLQTALYLNVTQLTAGGNMKELHFEVFHIHLLLS